MEFEFPGRGSQVGTMKEEGEKEDRGGEDWRTVGLHECWTNSTHQSDKSPQDTTLLEQK